MQNLEELQQYISQLTDESILTGHTVVAAPDCLPTPCFPDIISKVLGMVTEHEWDDLSERAQNYLKWITVKAESIDALAPRPLQSKTCGFELLAIDRDCNSFGEIVSRSQELNIPSVLLRFASLIATFLMVRLLRQHMKRDSILMPSMTFTQNVDANYLNYPHTLKILLELFPEYQQMFYFEINEEITEDYLRILREADHIFIDILHETGEYKNIWQAFAVLVPTKTVGVMGDARTYENLIALRAVTSTDGMTADYYDLPHDILNRCSSEIINKVKGVNRVVYDITSKPPGTIEWE